MLHVSTPESMSSRDIVKELVDDASLLMKRQVVLARIEAMHQLKKEKTVAEVLGTAGAVGYAGVVMLLVCAALAIGQALNGMYWLGALIVGGGLLFVATVMGAIGWSRRVREPLPRSRREAEKELTWAKHQLT